MPQPDFIPLRIAVLAVSDTRTLETDTSGAAIVERLEAAGHRIHARRLAPDDEEGIRAQVAAWVADPEVDAVLVTGGTGITARDVTPEAVRPLVTKPIPGFGELFRWLSFADIGASTIQSRAEGSLCGATLVFLLPGSTGAVRLALDQILLPQLDARTRPCNFTDLMPRFAKQGPKRPG